MGVVRNYDEEVLDDDDSLDTEGLLTLDGKTSHTSRSHVSKRGTVYNRLRRTTSRLLSNNSRLRWVLQWLITLVVGIALIASIVTFTLKWQSRALRSERASMRCYDPRIRKEWRALTRNERLEYLRAVKCLSSIPSRVIENGTLHDDFAYVHVMYDAAFHDSAAFLPWHRYFLQVYERTLHVECAFSGSLPYWNWSLDWHNLTKSPVFDSEEGFGGNGDVLTPTTVGDGHCIKDGPFAGLQVQYYGKERHPHCLSRGFNFDVRSEVLNGTEMAELMAQPDYHSFERRLEYGSHFVVPKTVRGDFKRHSSPNDPLFFVHHAQLDRIWWQWQVQDIDVRSYDYSGHARHGSPTKATLEDLLDLPGLVPSVSVESMMRTDGGVLCYNYE